MVKTYCCSRVHNSFAQNDLNLRKCFNKCPGTRCHFIGWYILLCNITQIFVLETTWSHTDITGISVWQFRFIFPSIHPHRATFTRCLSEVKSPLRWPLLRLQTNANGKRSRVDPIGVNQGFSTFSRPWNVYW